MTDRVAQLEELRAEVGLDVAHQEASTPPTLPDLLNEIERTLRRYVVMSDDAHAIVTVWVAHVFAFQAFEFTPYLAITSATKRSGKSRLLEVLEVILGPTKAISTANISPASLFRLIADKPGMAVLFDEVDRFEKEKADGLWGLVNSGWRLGGKAHRQTGQRMETLTEFSTFGPKVLAGIGQPLPDTTADRSLPIRMERRLPTETVERLRLRRATAEVRPLREALDAWANAETIARLANAEPALPEVTNDRLLDVAEPLLALADMAGEAWPERIRSAVKATEATAGKIVEEELGLLALRHVYEGFTAKQVDRLFTDDVLAHMVMLDDGPWAEWWGSDVDAGKTIAPARRLRKLLSAFDGIEPVSVRIGPATKKGYHLEPIARAASRYLSVTSVTSGTSLARHVTDVTHVTNTSHGEQADEPTVADVIANARGNGHSDEQIAAVLSTEQIIRPPTGAEQWSAQVVAQMVPRDDPATPEPGWRKLQREAGEDPATDEDASLRLVIEKLGARRSAPPEGERVPGGGTAESRSPVNVSPTSQTDEERGAPRHHERPV